MSSLIHSVYIIRDFHMPTPGQMSESDPLCPLCPLLSIAILDQGPPRAHNITSDPHIYLNILLGKFATSELCMVVFNFSMAFLDDLFERSEPMLSETYLPRSHQSIFDGYAPLTVLTAADPRID